MWNLPELVEQYISLTGGFGQPLALSKFSLTDEEVTRLFNTFDQDYHISRYLRFSNVNGKSYQISGERITHLSINESVKEIL
jgi:hypothetical protein